MNPDVLLMDEAFSALDVLTGETLRDDMLELWDESRISTKGILIVSHNIEEAVMMADRIIVFASDPGRIRSQVQIGLPRPRNPDSAEVRALIDEVYALMTSRPAHGAPTPRQQGLGYRFPQTEVERMEGVLDVLAEAPFNGRADLPKLAEEAEISDDDLLPACEALGLFGLAQIDRGDIFLTPLGQRYVLADQGQKQLIFGRQLLAHVPLAAHIRHSLEQEPTGQLPEKNFLDSLEEFLKPDEAERVLKIAVEWGRYGEIYGYDYRTGVLTLPEQEPAA